MELFENMYYMYYIYHSLIKKKIHWSWDRHKGSYQKVDSEKLTLIAP